MMIYFVGSCNCGNCPRFRQSPNPTTFGLMSGRGGANSHNCKPIRVQTLLTLKLKLSILHYDSLQTLMTTYSDNLLLYNKSYFHHNVYALEERVFGPFVVDTGHVFAALHFQLGFPFALTVTYACKIKNSQLSAFVKILMLIEVDKILV